MRKIWLLAVMAVCLSILIACSDGSSNNSASQQDQRTGTLGAPVTQNVSSAGGTVEASSYDTKVRLIFPAGALATDTVIKITPQTPATGDYVSFKLEPSNLFFAQPVTVVLEYPAGEAPDTSASLRQQMGGGSAYLETTVDKPAGTLTATLTTFGGATLDVLAKSASAPSLPAKGLSAGQMGSPPAPGNGTLTAQNITSISQRVSAAHDSLTRLQEAGLFEDALALNLSIADLLSRSGEDGYLASAEPFLQGAKDSACSLRNQAIVNSHSLTISAAGDYKKPAANILYWSSVAESLGGGACSGETTNNAVQALVQRELDFLTGKLQTAAVVTDLVGPASDVKDARRLKNEASILHTTASSAPILPQSYALAASPKPLAPVPSEIANTLQTVLLDPALDPARKAAWTVAQGAHTLLQYESLIDAFGSAPLLQQDVQFVLTRIPANIIDSSGNTLASSTLGIDVVPNLPADPKRSDSLTLLPGSTLRLSGNIATLECADQGPETLRGIFAGVEVATVTSSGPNLLAGNFADLTPAWLLQQAGLPAEDTGSHTLLIRRTSPCAAKLGLTDDLLATLTLRFGAPPRLAFLATPLVDPDHHNDVWMLQAVAANGSGLTTLLSGTQAGCSGCVGNLGGPASWSPDGQHLVYPGYTPPSYAADLWIANVDGSGATVVPNSSSAASPNWTPDGKKFVYRSGSGQIMSSNIDGSSPLALTSGATDYSVVLSGNGKRMLVERLDPTPGGSGYVSMDSDGSNIAPVNIPWAQSIPALSPDGSQIAFITANDVDWQLIVANSDGSNQSVIHHIPQHDIPAGEGNPRNLAGPVSWSPEGNQIAFLLHQTLIVGDPDGITYDYLCPTTSLWLVKSDGSGLTEVRHGDRTISYALPAWSR